LSGAETAGGVIAIATAGKEKQTSKENRGRLASTLSIVCFRQVIFIAARRLGVLE
jgi:hypothetical protein